MMLSLFGSALWSLILAMLVRHLPVPLLLAVGIAGALHFFTAYFRKRLFLNKMGARAFWLSWLLCLILAPIFYVGLAGKEILHELAVGGQARGIQFLVSLGYDIDALNGFGCTPLLTAVHQGSEPAIIEKLVSIGAIPDFAGENCGPAVYDAVASRKTDMLKALLDAGADPDLAGPGGETPLTLAASRGDAEILYVLLMAGANPKLQDGDGNAPLHRLFAGEVATLSDCRLSVIDETVVMAKNLINKGADLNDENRAGESAAQLAKDVCEGEILKALQP